MKLNFKRLGSGQPLIITHGVFGSLDNWITLGKKLSEHFEVFLVDARNHGQSAWSDEFTYEAMAKDFYDFIRNQRINESIFMGHSMGGKTAMELALNYPEVISKLIVVDIAPKAYPPHHQDILAGLNALDFNTISSRTEADEILAQYISVPAIRQFLLKNLYWEEKGKLALRFNLKVINEQINKVGDTIIHGKPFVKPSLFVGGGQSGYITSKDYDQIKALFPLASIAMIPEAGHWIHAEAPEKFLKIILDFLN